MNNANKQVYIQKFSFPVIDSHCHLSLIEDRHPTLHKELEELSSGEMYLLDIGIEPNDIHYRKKKFSHYKNIYFSAGLHPNYCENYTIQQAESLLHQSIPIADAIGECGLDWFAQKSSKEKQKDIFRLHLTMAFKYKKPLIIHSRNSLEDIIQEISTFYKIHHITIQSLQHPIGVIHCFSGTKEQAKQCISLGFYISFTANISYKKNISLQEVLKTIPIDTLLLETDSPYLSHQTIRSELNHPKNMPLLYKTAAALLSMNMDTLIQNTKKNFVHFLQL